MLVSCDLWQLKERRKLCGWVWSSVVRCGRLWLGVVGCGCMRMSEIVSWVISEWKSYKLSGVVIN